jgi:hypothetical protein
MCLDKYMFYKEKNMKRVNLLEKLVLVSVCLLWVICPAQASFFGIDGDAVNIVTESESGYSHYRVTNNHSSTSYWAYFYVDLGSVENVSSFILTNRTDYTSGFNIDLFNIYSAADETVAGFDPAAKSSYTTVVYASGYSSGTAGDERTATLASEQNKQYFMFEISSIHARWLGTTTNVADFDSLVAVPEPAVLSFLAFGGLGLLRKRK